MIRPDRLKALFLDLVRIDSPSRREKRIAERLAAELRTLDAEVMVNRRGFEVVNLGTGMRDIHTTAESVRVSDMVAAAEVTLATIALAAESA